MSWMKLSEDLVASVAQDGEIMTKKVDKLAQDVAKADAAGMSYGKWMAMQHDEKRHEPDELPVGWKICPNCGRRFKSRQGKRFCDDVCRRQAYADKAREQDKNYRMRKKGLIQ